MAQMGSMPGLGGAAAKDTPGPVQFVKSNNPDQYFVVPVALTVYVEQDRIPDLLVELRNSPMSIRVLDFEMITPLVPVKKPRKGADESAFAGAMLSGRGRSAMSGGLMGDETMMPAGGGGGGGGPQMTMANMNGASDAYSAAMKAGGNRSAMQQAAGKGKAKAKARAGGEDVKAESIANLRKNRKGSDKGKDQEKADDEDAESSISNPYFNVVEVKIRGQARFYLPPPKSATPEPTATANAAAARRAREGRRRGRRQESRAGQGGGGQARRRQGRPQGRQRQDQGGRHEGHGHARRPKGRPSQGRPSQGRSQGRGPARRQGGRDQARPEGRTQVGRDPAGRNEGQPQRRAQGRPGQG